MMRSGIICLFIVLAFSLFSVGCTGTDGGSTSSSSAYPKAPTGLAESRLTKLDGSTFSINDHKGTVLLVNIWGTWCGPCRAEVPHLIALKNKYGSKGFEVLGLNIGDSTFQPESDDAINGFARQFGINYVIARSPVSATTHFYAFTKQQVVPQTMLIDREGRIRNTFIGGGNNVFEQMKRQVEKVMSE